jgi:Rieske Fe-S protein
LFPADETPKGSATDPKGGDWIFLGKLADLPENKEMRVTTATRVRNGKTIKKPKLVVWRKDTSVYVMSSKCTHLGCEVARQEGGTYLCPCHGSTYNPYGKVTGGPAKSSLSWYEVRITENGGIEVNIDHPIEPPAAK